MRCKCRLPDMAESDGRPHIRAILLGVVCLMVLAMLWLMHSEKAQIQQMSTIHSAPVSHTRQEDKVQVVFQAPPPNITNIIMQDKEEEKKWDYNWDLKQWSNPDEAKGVGVRTLILVRHGKYNYSTGLLTDLGRQQANQTGIRLREMGMKIDRIYHSTMDRARETAEIIHRYFTDVPMQSDPVLEEGGPVPPSPTITYWGLPERQYFVEGPRLESAFRKYCHRADKSQTQQTHELIVGHGNLFRFFALRALQLEISAWMRVFIAHGSITILHINPDSTVTMTRFGDSGHFPHSMVTF